MTDPAPPTERVRVRDATVEDVEELVALLGHGALGSAREEPGDAAPYGRALAEITGAPGRLLVADLDGRPVGMCQLIVFRHFQHRGGRCAEIESLHVHPDLRSLGIGAVLVAAAVDTARREGCYRVQLTSNLERTAAHRFYERLGFVPSHRGFKLALGAGD